VEGSEWKEVNGRKRMEGSEWKEVNGKEVNERKWMEGRE
jgi:hypothetical protein